MPTPMIQSAPRPATKTKGELTCPARHGLTQANISQTLERTVRYWMASKEREKAA